MPKQDKDQDEELTLMDLFSLCIDACCRGRADYDVQWRRLETEVRESPAEDVVDETLELMTRTSSLLIARIAFSLHAAMAQHDKRINSTHEWIRPLPENIMTIQKQLAGQERNFLKLAEIQAKTKHVSNLAERGQKVLQLIKPGRARNEAGDGVESA